MNWGAPKGGRGFGRYWFEFLFPVRGYLVGLGLIDIRDGMGALWWCPWRGGGCDLKKLFLRFVCLSDFTICGVFVFAVLGLEQL